MKCKIVHIEGLAYSDAYDLAEEGLAELRKDRVAPRSCMLHNSYNAFVAYQDEGQINVNPIGVIVYTHILTEKQLFIILGYVKKEYRHKGVYTQIWEKLVEQAQKQNCVHIEGATHAFNFDAQQAIERMADNSRELVSLVYRFNVPEKENKDG